jgi:hypothetical protein
LLVTHVSRIGWFHCSHLPVECFVSSDSLRDESFLLYLRYIWAFKTSSES